MGQSYKSVSEMIKQLSEGSGFATSAIKGFEKRQVAKLLFLLRCKSALSQKDMAEKLGCSQSRISKIENSNDENLSLKDLIDYARVLKLQLDIGFASPAVKIVDRVKHHAFKMRHYLDQLCDLVGDDPEMEKAVRDFYGEAFVNVMKLIAESYGKLPLKRAADTKKPLPIRVSGPSELLQAEN